MEPLSKNSPGSGEQAAIRGYYPQYRKAAAITLQHWADLEWISIADSTAGKVDDFQIATKERLDAYQVKWSGKPESNTLRSLTASKPNKPSIFRQLSEGWRNRCETFPNLRVAVHYTTNGYPSHSSPISRGGKSADHFESFLNEAWFPVHLGKLPSIEQDGRWKEGWTSISEDTGLSDRDLLEFVHDCVLEFQADLEPPALNEREQKHWIELAIKLTEGLFENTASSDRKNRLTKEEVARICKVEQELTLQNVHEFRFNEKIFKRQLGIEKEIEDALLDNGSRYICLCGAPGSGKSTLLTFLTRNRSENVVRYYAYTPDSKSLGPIRGEASNFFHDVLHELHRHGFTPRDSSPHHFDLTVLRLRFGEALLQAHLQWKKDGKKTLILIDGLDHIEREQHPDRSILDFLPKPTEVPDGVVFLLGSQTTVILTSEIQQHLEEGRILFTKPLGRGDVRAILLQALSSGHSIPGQIDQLVKKTAGHPLAIEMVAARLVETKTSSEIERILEVTDRYEGDIGQSYRSYFERIQSNETADVLTFLSLVARLRGPTINLEWIRSWAEPSTFLAFKRQCFQFFHREGTNWRIFHNSFRLFLTRITSQGAPGEFDDVHDRSLHAEIAERCRTLPENCPLRWEEFYHLAQAGDQSSIREFISLGRFESQFVNGRLITLIFEDLRLARIVMQKTRDALLLLRLALTTHKFDRRQSHAAIDDQELYIAAIRGQRWDIVKSRVASSGQLHISAASALDLVNELLDQRLFQEACDLFSRISPSELERGGGFAAGSSSRQRSLLAEWGAVALHFWRLEDVIQTIESFEFWETKWDRPGVLEGPEIDQESHRARTIAELASLLRSEGNESESREALRSCNWRKLIKKDFFRLRSSLIRWQMNAGKIEFASVNLLKLLSKYEIETEETRVSLAIWCGKLGLVEQGKRLVSNVPIKLEDCNSALRLEKRHRDKLFHRCVAACLLGECSTPEQLIPQAGQEQKAFRFFALEEARIADYSARIYQNTFPSPEEFRNDVDALFWRLSRDLKWPR